MKQPMLVIVGMVLGVLGTLGITRLMTGDGSGTDGDASRERAETSAQRSDHPEAVYSAAGPARDDRRMVALELPVAPPALSASNDSRIGVLVYGSISDASGQPVVLPEEEGIRWLRFVNAVGDERSLSIDDDGTYSVTGLQPGIWRVRATIAGFRPLEDELPLVAEQPVVQHDLTLERAIVLDIRGFTPDGQPLLEALQSRMPDAAWGVRLTAVATIEAPGAQLPPITERAYDRYGIGWYHDRLELFQCSDGDPPDSMGHLEVFEALPAFVSLVLRHVVLQTQRVEAGATTVTFTVPWDLIETQFGSVRVQVIDADTGAPLTEASADLSDSQSMRSGTKPDQEGVYLWERQRPGLLGLTIHCKDHETWVTEVNVPPGGQADLGTIRLGPATRIAGTVQDPEGHPHQVQLFAFPMGRFEETFSILSRTIVLSDAAGHFAFAALGRHQYEIRISPQEWAAHATVVDARSGDREGLILAVEAGTEVAIEARWPVSRRLGVEITYRDGSVAMPHRSWYGGWSQTWHMLRGTYDVRIFDGDGLLRTIPLEVGEDRIYLPLEP